MEESSTKRERFIVLSGVQMNRVIYNAGGLWSLAGFAKVCGYSHKYLSKLRRDPKSGWPIPATEIHVRYSPDIPLYTGEDLLAWLEATDRWHGAEQFYVAIQEHKLMLKNHEMRGWQRPYPKPERKGDYGRAGDQETTARENEGSSDGGVGTSQ